MEDAEKVFDGKRMKSRIIALIEEETDYDLLHIILALLADARMV